MAMMMRGTDILREEHQIILKALKILDAFCMRLEQGKKVESDHLKQIVTFIAEYSDDYHHAKEEEVLLPFISKAALKKWKEVEEILDEHILQRGYVEAMGDVLARDCLLSSEKDLQKFVGHARNLIGFLSEHILKEDSVLLPQAERFFTEDQQKELFQAFRDLDAQKNSGCLVQNSLKDLFHLEKIYLVYKQDDQACCGCCGHG